VDEHQRRPMARRHEMQSDIIGNEAVVLEFHEPSS
jgi:hypothetical protein